MKANVAVPKEMRRQSRPVLQDFDPDELLYYRLEEYYPVGSHPSGLSIRRPEFSVNRQKHGGKAEYVLIPDWPDHGIAEFLVSRLPGELKSDGGTLFAWRPIHDPNEDNYYHSEVRTYKGIDAKRVAKGTQINDLVWREFKQRLSEKMTVIKSYTGDEL